MSVNVHGKARRGVSAKDIVLAIVGRLGTGGGAGYVIEYRGEAIQDLSLEGRMTVCNMSIEAGARAGLIAVDDKTIEYLRCRPGVPRGDAFDEAQRRWRDFVSDDDATFDTEIFIDASELSPYVTWGTNPAQVVTLDGNVPSPHDFDDPDARDATQRSLTYMDLTPGTLVRSIPLDVVFIGSCTNSRIEDLRAAAEVAKGQHVATSVRALVVPGSHRVKVQAEDEAGPIFLDAGFEWREPGCSMCLGMNPDQLQSGQRCASTSNRNFEGRQGRGGRTHLVSPVVAAASAIVGRFASPDEVR